MYIYIQKQEVFSAVPNREREKQRERERERERENKGKKRTTAIE
jgi:hypothetical protein